MWVHVDGGGKCPSACSVEGPQQAKNGWVSASFDDKCTKVSLCLTAAMEEHIKALFLFVFLLLSAKKCSKKFVLQSKMCSIFVKEKKKNWNRGRRKKHCMPIWSGRSSHRSSDFHCPTLFESFCTVFYFGIKQVFFKYIIEMFSCSCSSSSCEPILSLGCRAASFSWGKPIRAILPVENTSYGAVKCFPGYKSPDFKQSRCIAMLK